MTHHHMFQMSIYRVARYKVASGLPSDDGKELGFEQALNNVWRVTAGRRLLC